MLVMEIVGALIKINIGVAGGIGTWAWRVKYPSTTNTDKVIIPNKTPNPAHSQCDFTTLWKEGLFSI
jgi:hypothetical protein